jgi:hypothetical protein
MPVRPEPFENLTERGIKPSDGAFRFVTGDDRAHSLVVRQKGLGAMSESDEKDDVEAAGDEEQATPASERKKIKDPLTQSGFEGRRMPWQPQRPSPPGSQRESDEGGAADQSAS